MMLARRTAPRTLVLAVVAMLAVLAGCSSGSLSSTTTVTSTTNGAPDAPNSSASGESSSSPSPSPSPSPTVLPPVASIAATPALNSTGLSPVQPISFTVDKGTIDDVTLTNPEGKVVVATISADKTSWSVGEVLGCGKTYTLAGTATGTDGKQVPIAGTYTTVGADTQTRNTVNPADAAVVGVAAPISV